MKSRKVSYMPYVGGFLLAVLVLAGPFLFPASRVAHAHTFSTSESLERTEPYFLRDRSKGIIGQAVRGYTIVVGISQCCTVVVLLLFFL
jgi:hypothetical protein